jgi:hypothetical protein
MNATAPPDETFDHINFKPNTYIYLASPHSHESHDERGRRFRETEQVIVSVLKLGISIFSPVVYCHPLSILYNTPTEFPHWEFLNLGMIRACEELWVLCMNGIAESKGVKAEIEFAQSLEIPIKFLTGRARQDDTIPFITIQEAQDFWQVPIV